MQNRDIYKAKLKTTAKNAYILELADEIEKLRAREEKAARAEAKEDLTKNIDQVILKYTGVKGSLEANEKALRDAAAIKDKKELDVKENQQIKQKANKIYRDTIKLAKKNLELELSKVNKFCDTYEANTHALQGRSQEYEKSLSERRTLRAERAMLHLLEPIKNYNEEMLVDWYQYYELVNPSHETTFNKVSVGAKYFDKFLALNRDNAGKNLPAIRIEGKALGYPGFYLRKLNVADMDDAVLAALLGKYSSCCQSYSGENGQSCTEHGLTDPDGCFYVLFKENPTGKDTVCAQAWTWREGSNVCFDSIEAHNDFQNPEDLKRTQAMFGALATELTQKQDIQTVSNGYFKGFSKDIGYKTHYHFSSARIDAKKYQGHQDSSNQHLLADKRLLVSPFQFDEKAENKALFTELKKLQSGIPLHQSENLVYTIGFALQNQRKDMLDYISKTATTLGVNEKLNAYLKTQDDFLQKQKEYVKSKDCKAMLDYIQKNPVDLNLFNGNTPFIMFAAEAGHEDLIDYLLKQKIPVDISDQVGFTALYNAASGGHANIVAKLLDNGADIRGCQLAMTALSAAVSGGHAKVIQMLLEKDPRTNKDSQKIKDISSAAEVAIRNGDDKTLALLLSARCIDFSHITSYGTTESVRHLLIPHMEFKYPIGTLGAFLSQQEKKPELLIRLLIDDLHLLGEKYLTLTAENEQKKVTAFKDAAEKRILQLESTATQEKFRIAIKGMCDNLKIKSQVKTFEDKRGGVHSHYTNSFYTIPAIESFRFYNPAPRSQPVDYKIQLRNLNTSLPEENRLNVQALDYLIATNPPPQGRDTFTEVELDGIKRNIENMWRLLRERQQRAGRGNIV